MIISIKKFFMQQRAAPFETMLGFFCIYGGIAGLLDFGVASNAFKYILGYKITMLFNALYAIAGSGMFFGIGLNKHNIEAFGLITVATSIIIRTVAIGYIIGPNPLIINTYVLNVTFVLSCMARLVTVIRYHKALNADAVTIITK